MNAGGFGALLGGELAWPAPAKLNLCLYIVGRRDDGYHLLQSAMQFIDLADELRFYRRAPGVIERVAGPADIPSDQDLAVRAARLLAAEIGGDRGVGIALDARADDGEAGQLHDQQQRQEQADDAALEAAQIQEGRQRHRATRRD